MFSQIKCVFPLEGSPRKLQKNAGRLKDAQSYNESTVLLPFALSFPGSERVKADSRRDTGARQSISGGVWRLLCESRKEKPSSS